MLDVLAKRFAKYGLTLHPDKTQLVPFDRPRGGAANAGARPGMFDLLGFTHYWGRSFRGWWIVKRQTARTRLSRALSESTSGVVGTGIDRLRSSSKLSTGRCGGITATTASRRTFPR